MIKFRKLFVMIFLPENALHSKIQALWFYLFQCSNFKPENHPFFMIKKWPFLSIWLEVNPPTSERNGLVISARKNIPKGSHHAQKIVIPSFRKDGHGIIWKWKNKSKINLQVFWNDDHPYHSEMMLMSSHLKMICGDKSVWKIYNESIYDFILKWRAFFHIWTVVI